VSRHQRVSDETREQAALYSLGLLPHTESQDFERHLEECEVCWTEVKAFREAAGEIAFAIPEVNPAPRLRQKLLRRIAPKSSVVRAHQVEWQKTAFEGVEVRQLFLDSATGTITSMVRLAPGAKYPSHRHANLEHCYVLEGDLVSNDHTLHAGDYEVNAPDTDHSPVTSHGGCLLLIIHNAGDQLLA